MHIHTYSVQLTIVSCVDSCWKYSRHLDQQLIVDSGIYSSNIDVYTQQLTLQLTVVET